MADGSNSVSSSTDSSSSNSCSAASTPSAADKVDTAVSQVQDLTREDGLLGTSRNANMQSVADTIGDLSPAELDATVSKLSDADLKGLAEDINAGGVLGAQGLTADEKHDVFNDLAAGLSGAQLGRVSEAFNSREDVAALAEAVATFATPEAKVGYVEAMASRTTDGLKGEVERSMFGLAGSVTYKSDAEALAVGTVLGSLQGVHFDTAVSSLSKAELGAVMKSSAELTTNQSPTGAMASHYDVGTLTGILNAAATSQNASVKASVFAQGGTMLGEIANAGSAFSVNSTAAAEAAKVRDSLQGLLDTDVTGVVRQLETADRYGGAMTSFLTETLKQGKPGEAVVGGYVAKLQTGNALNENPITRLETQVGGYHRNAQDLGYFAGAAQAAVDKATASEKAKAEMVGGIFKSAVGLATGSAGPVAGAAIGMYTDALVKDGVAAYAAGTASLKDTFFELSFPHDPTTKTPYEGPAEGDYDTALGRVLDGQR
ncbi:hypothetical protein [Caulobacter sp.]|uniref:hypothetical protein n=1 Tax=Caulobacter sp. TaxID=78 RepID=UPI001610CD0E